MHAFAHALLSVLAYLRDALALSPPSNSQPEAPGQSYMLSEISLHYIEYEGVIVALSSLCQRVSYSCNSSTKELNLCHEGYWYLP